MSITRLIYQAYCRNRDMFYKLFGYPRSLDDDGIPIANNRRFPADISFQSQWEYDHTSRANLGENWILWSEIKESGVIGEAESHLQKESLIIFDILQSFARWYGDDGVRLIIWWAK